MAQWDIPHDERHRFLEWGARDETFHKWCANFETREIPYEVGGGADRWTIYKHQWFVDDSTGRTSRCCPMDTEL